MKSLKPSDIWTIASIAVLSFLIPYLPLVSLIAIVLLLLAMGAVHPKGIYLKASLILFVFYFGLAIHSVFFHPNSQQFGKSLFLNILSGFPALFIAIIFVLFVGSFIRGIFTPLKDSDTKMQA